MSARARPTTARVRRSATACGAPPTAARHWTHLGLENTQSIGRIVVDSTDPNIVYVAAVGHLFGPNPDRGLYKSTDGGKTWKKSKYIDPDTGFNDVAIDPSNPKILYASSFQRRRTWWGYNGGGPGSALWKTTDGGDTWTKLDGPGWPKPKDGIYGRIAISIFRANPKIVYAQVEAGASGGTGGGTTAEGGPAPRGGRGGGFGGETPAGRSSRGAARRLAAVAEAVARGGRGATAPPDPNGSGVFRSDDGGKTWTFMSNQNQRPTYFSQIRVDPVNDKKILRRRHARRRCRSTAARPGQPLRARTPITTRSGSTRRTRALSMVGHDGGLDISNDGGFNWDYHNDIAVGQFYQVSADMRRPYFVCGGLQDNNAWCGPSALRSNTGPVNTDWFTVAGGDGFYTRQDPYDWAIVYGESQDGSMTRHDLRTGTQKSIRPDGRRLRRGGTHTPRRPRMRFSGRTVPPSASCASPARHGHGAGGPEAAGATWRRRWRRRPRRPSQRHQRARRHRAVPLLLERAV